MKHTFNKMGQWLLSKLLLLLGFSCTMVFMACYGTMPRGYVPEDDSELEEFAVVDSTVVDEPAED